MRGEGGALIACPQLRSVLGLLSGAAAGESLPLMLLPASVPAPASAIVLAAAGESLPLMLLPHHLEPSRE